jgi:hypothetical protein
MVKGSAGLTEIMVIAVYFVSSCLPQKIQMTTSGKDGKLLEIVRNELPSYLEKIPNGSEMNFGFRNREEFKEALPASPFPLYIIKNNELRKTSMIIVPVLIGKDYRALATIDSVRNELHVVDFGASHLADEIQDKILKYPELSFTGILRVYSVFSDFMIMSENSSKIFIPMLSGQKYLSSKDISYDRGLQFNEILGLIGHE